MVLPKKKETIDWNFCELRILKFTIKGFWICNFIWKRLHRNIVGLRLGLFNRIKLFQCRWIVILRLIKTVYKIWIVKIHWKKNFNDTDIIVVPWPILYWRFTENQGLLVLVQPVCVFQPYELLLLQYFWLTVKYCLLNYLKIFSYIHMADKSQAFLSVYVSWIVHLNCEIRLVTSERINSMTGKVKLDTVGYH